MHLRFRRPYAEHEAVARRLNLGLRWRLRWKRYPVAASRGQFGTWHTSSAIPARLRTSWYAVAVSVAPADRQAPTRGAHSLQDAAGP